MVNGFAADDARLAAMHGYAPHSLATYKRDVALRAAFRRVLVDRLLTRCERESARVLRPTSHNEEIA